MPVTNQDRNNIRRLIQKIETELRPLIAQAAKDQGVTPSADILKVMTAQNALKACMEVVLDECMPFDRVFLPEMAIRLAAYAISASPIEDHEENTRLVIAELPNAVVEKVRKGAVIRTMWRDENGARPNIPERGDLQ